MVTLYLFQVAVCITVWCINRARHGIEDVTIDVSVLMEQPADIGVQIGNKLDPVTFTAH